MSIASGLDACASCSETFHAWAWPWQPIIELKFIRMDAACPLSRVYGFSEGEMCIQVVVDIPWLLLILPKTMGGVYGDAFGIIGVMPRELSLIHI